MSDARLGEGGARGRAVGPAHKYVREKIQKRKSGKGIQIFRRKNKKFSNERNFLIKENFKLKKIPN